MLSHPRRRTLTLAAAQRQCGRRGCPPPAQSRTAPSTAGWCSPARQGRWSVGWLGRWSVGSGAGWAGLHGWWWWSGRQGTWPLALHSHARACWAGRTRHAGPYSRAATSDDVIYPPAPPLRAPALPLHNNPVPWCAWHTAHTPRCCISASRPTAITLRAKPKDQPAWQDGQSRSLSRPQPP